MRWKTSLALIVAPICRIGSIPDILGVPPLVEAANAGDRTVAIALIEKKVNVNTPEADGTTALDQPSPGHRCRSSRPPHSSRSRRQGEE